MEPTSDPGRGGALRLDRREFLGVAAVAGLGPVLAAPAAFGSGQGPPLPPCGGLRTRALVIGVNDYRNAPCLKNPVRDACRFAQWLVTKGGLDPADVVLLTSPNPPPQGVAPPAGVRLGSATRQDLLVAIEGFPARAGERERLYFYYSGHGVGFESRGDDGTIQDKDAIVPSDYQVPGTKPIPINWILALLGTSRYVEQFFFFDACRNVQDEINPDGGHVVSKALTSGLPFRYQYIMFATAPRRKTLDITGAFTDVLLGALYRGLGTAKSLAPGGSFYLVNWSSLASFLIAYFNANRITVGEENGQPIFLQPERKILPGDFLPESPCLCSLQPETDVPDAALVIQIQPPSIQPAALITIGRADGTVVVPSSPWKSSYPLRPLFDYIVTAECDHVRLVQSWTLIDDHTMDFAFGPPTGAAATLAPIPEAVERLMTVQANVSRAAASTPPPAMAAPAAPGGGAASLTIRSPDPLAPVELVDASGAPIRRERGSCLALGELRVGGLKPGVYRARTYGPGGTMTERLLSLTAGVATQLDLGPTPAAAAPAPFGPSRAEAMLDDLRGSRLPEGGMSPVAPAPTTNPLGSGFRFIHTVRTLRTQPVWDDLVKRLDDEKKNALTRLEGSPGIRIVLAVEGESPIRAREVLEQVKVRFGPLDAKTLEPLRAGPSVVGPVDVYHVDTAPGPYRVRVERGGDSAEFALVLIAERISALILEQEADGGIRISQLAPAVRPPRPSDADVALKLERLQRDLQGDQSRGAPLLLDMLARAGVDEPIVPVIGAYFASIVGGAEPLGQNAAHLVRTYPTLPDGYVAMARAFEARGAERDARGAYAEALDRGLPMLAVFSTFLLDGVTRFDIDHPRGKLLKDAAEHLIPHRLWTAWRPVEG